MGRRSLISMTTINRLISASNRIQRERYNNNLIHSQGGNEKERAPVYVLQSVEFNMDTRIARLEFLQKQEYRTIQRYVTQNYVKYPIYSEWKQRIKSIKKTIKLTNSELEVLNNNEDFLIRNFAEEIVIALNNEELFPSWFLRVFLKRELDEKIKKSNEEFVNFRTCKQEEIDEEKDIINTQRVELNLLKNKLSHATNRFEKIRIRLQKVAEKRKNIIKSLITFGIYSYLISNTRKSKFDKKLQALSNKINELESVAGERERIICDSEKKIDRYEIQIKDKYKEIKDKKDFENLTYNQKIADIQPLENLIKADDKFVALKLFSGFEYEKIIGCYVIHNKEKDKSYVGQSKDVMRRIKQHFKGTVPNNQVFAEDYYTSLYSDKENLFEIKVIRCETKDELDRIERELIYEYDSRNNGYNGTSGNT